MCLFQISWGVSAKNQQNLMKSDKYITKIKSVTFIETKRIYHRASAVAGLFAQGNVSNSTFDWKCSPFLG